MGGPCKIIPGSPWDQLRAHLPHSANKNPPLESGEAKCAALGTQERLTNPLPGGKKFSDTKAPHLGTLWGYLTDQKKPSRTSTAS